MEAITFQFRLPSKIQKLNVYPHKKKKWKIHTADWPKFNKLVNFENIPAPYEEQNINTCVEKLNQNIIQAANESILATKGLPRKNCVVLWNEEHASPTETNKIQTI